MAKKIEIILNSKTIGDAHSKTGMYRASPEGTLSRNTMYRQIELAFRDYVMSHKKPHITKELCDESWRRFLPFLQGRLGK